MREPTCSVTIYTDGGADPNPGMGGWAAILIDDASERVKELSGGEPRSTNNRMELTAAIRALEALRQPCKVRLFTDSQYLKKGITQWLPGWMARGWKRKDGELQNEDLWRRLAELIREHEIHWGWVRGHAGHRWNERADKLATQEIRKLKAARNSAKGAAAAPPPAARIYLRVSCSRGQGGWAALVRQNGGEAVLSGVASGITPNKLDLIAATEALEQLPPGTSVAIYTGSDYLRNGATRWLPAWKRRGWRTQEGEPVSNRDLWERLEAAMAARKVEWPPVQGEEVPELEALGITAKEAREGKG